MIEQDVVSHLIHLIRNNTNNNVKDQAMWALNNIIAIDIKAANKELIAVILNEMNNTKTPILCCKILVTITLQRKYFPELQTISKVIKNAENIEVIEESCRILKNLSDDNPEVLVTLINEEVLPYLVQLLDYPCAKTVLKLLDNYLVHGDSEVQFIIDAGIVPQLTKLINNKDLQKEALWSLSNIVEGVHLQSVLNTGIIPAIIKLSTENEFKVRRECICLLANAAINGNALQVKYLLQFEIIEVLCGFLTENDVNTVAIALEGIRSILEKFEEVKPRVETCKGLDSIEKLQEHPNTDIQQKSHAILVDFFNDNSTDILFCPLTIDFECAEDGCSEQVLKCFVSSSHIVIPLSGVSIFSLKYRPISDLLNFNGFLIQVVSRLCIVL